jgi:hypothetical protein
MYAFTIKTYESTEINELVINKLTQHAEINTTHRWPDRNLSKWIFYYPKEKNSENINDERKRQNTYKLKGEKKSRRVSEVQRFLSKANNIV